MQLSYKCKHWQRFTYKTKSPHLFQDADQKYFRPYSLITCFLSSLRNMPAGVDMPDKQAELFHLHR